MAAALYNRYRPRTFGEVVGQSQVTDALRQALTSGRMHHAYLFSGPRGCGKTSSARILAASLNCVNGPTPEPCGVCEHCVAIRSGSSVDVVEIDAASHGGVDDARDLRERAAFSPASSRYRVFIVDEAHMITKDGFNALLKVVEEPPDHLIFVFATTEPEKVLATIRSRTFHYQFGLVPPSELAGHLRNICAAEGVTVEPAVVPLVVRVAEGSVRDSLSVLDQLLAGVGDEGLSYATAVARLGFTDTVLLDEAVDALGDKDSSALFGVVERVLGSGADPRRFATDLLERLRDLLLLDAVPDARDRGLLDLVPDDQMERMRGQASRLGGVELSRAADVVHNALVEMRGTTSPRLSLELLCARILLPGAASDVGSLLVRLERLERRFSLAGEASQGGAPVVAAAPASPAPQPSSLPAVPPPAERPVRPRVETTRPAEPAPAAAPPPPPAAPPKPVVADWPETVTAPPVSAPEPTPAPAATPAPEPVAAAAPTPAPSAPGSLDIAAVRLAWPQALDAVKSKSRVAFVKLSQHAEPARLEGSVLTLSVSNPALARQFTTEQMQMAADALAEVLGGTWKVQVAAGAEAAPAAGPAPSSEFGFAPGDEAVEDDPSLPKPSAVDLRAQSEDAAVALLREQMGATVLGEIRP